MRGLESMSEFMSWFDGATWTFIDALVTMLTLGLVIYNWYTNYRQAKEINIVFQSEKSKIRQVSKITRRFISRAEINGLLGVLQKDSSHRFNIEYLSSKNYLDDISAVQNGKLNEIIIKVTDEELKQFNI